jgi:hypothetical protein
MISDATKNCSGSRSEPGTEGYRQFFVLFF